MIQKSLVLVGLLLFSTFSIAAPVPPCISPNPGSADFPSGFCDYTFDLSITAGMPPGTTIEISATLNDFDAIVESPGGTLGGTQQTMIADLDMVLIGTGLLTGFSRFISVPMAATVDLGPRVGGDTQSFAITIDQLSGELFGDPDFDVFSFKMGYGFSLANSGSATYYNLYSESWYTQLVLSFDYQLGFQGAPGGILEGFAGTTSSDSILIIGDSDGDGVVDTSDNCVAVPNPDQLDDDGNGVGNVCEPPPGC